MWSYPIGAIVNMGEPLTKRTVRGPMPFTIGEVSHGPLIFERWPLEDIAALGIKLYSEDSVPQFHTPGDPDDVETETTITRTYPNAVLDETLVAKSIADSKTAKMAEIISGAESMMACCSRGYCADERASWDQQVRQAAALALDPDAADTDLVRNIAAARGMNVADLVQRIQANAANWCIISGSAIGQKGAYKDALDSAQDVTAVQAITVAYVMPEGAEAVQFSLGSE
jgi:hypothetical protein